jgi:adenine-specific DNA glycosylase
MLVCCALLNRTHGRQVRPVYQELFRRWPTPAALARAGGELERFVRPLGLWRRRAALLRRLSMDWRTPHKCAGVGQYALDSHAIFVLGRLDVRPKDGKLSSYLRWRKRWN